MIITYTFCGSKIFNKQFWGISPIEEKSVSVFWENQGENTKNQRLATELQRY